MRFNCLKSIIGVIFLINICTSFKTSKSDCKDYLKNNDYYVDKEIRFIKKKKKFEILEVLNKYNDESFLMLIEDDTIFNCNQNSLLNNSDYQGFSLSELNKTKKGFFFSIEYGSIVYRQIRFDFIYKRDKFYLELMYISSFSKANPSKINKEVIDKTSSKISFDEFDIQKLIDF